MLKYVKICTAMLLAVCLAGVCTGCGGDEEAYEDSSWSEESSSAAYKLFGSLGSATEMSGKTVVLSVFANDSNCYWDWDQDEDNETAYDMLDYTAIATDWITKNAAGYGCDAEFVYDWDADENLVYDADCDGDLTSDEDCDTLAWTYIDKNIDSSSILKTYDADNIVYLFFINTDESLDSTSCTRNYYEGMAYPYEVCYIYAHCGYEEETPASIAHEILHTFGAPDLYVEDTEGDNYGITAKFVKQMEKEESNDIMFTTYDCSSQEPYYDKITNELTELDAYYVGLTDSSEVADQWGLDASQHTDK